MTNDLRAKGLRHLKQLRQSNTWPSLLLASITLLVFCAVGRAQEPELGSASIALRDGFLFVNNGKDKSFTFELHSKEIEPLSSGSNPTFKMDERIVQIVILPNEDFMAKLKTASEENLLVLHQTWEGGYLEKEIYHAKLRIESEPFSVKDRKMLFWGFTRPSMLDVFDRDYFLTTIIGKRLLGLSSPIKVGESISDYKKLFVDILSTLHVSDKPFDIAKLSDQVKKGTYKGN